MLDAELGLGDLVLVELAERHGTAPLSVAVMCCEPMQCDQRGIDGVVRPAERRLARAPCERLPPDLAGADGRDHLLADRVLLGGVGVADGLERMVGALPGALDDRFPGGRVRILEAREQANERRRSLAVLMRSSSASAKHFAAAALKHLRVRDDLADEPSRSPHARCASALHALARFLPFGGGRHALGIERSAASPRPRRSACGDRRRTGAG